jgi:carboxymethylenebutenolidase
MKFLLALAGLSVPLMSSLQAANVIHSEDRFTSGGKDIRLESYTPENASSDSPAILVLHGSTGVEFANRFIAGIAEQFAAQGFTVHLLHYFDRTGTTYANDVTIRATFEEWRATVNDAVMYLKAQNPGTPLGIFGYSLGGYLAAATGVRNKDVSAVVVLAGGLDELTAKLVKRSAPVLILHGDSDERVPVTEARQLEASLKKAGASPQLHIYPGEGHVMQIGTYVDVVSRGTTFFREKLGGS